MSTASKAAAVSAMCISLKSLAGAALCNISKITFGLANYPSHKKPNKRASNANGESLVPNSNCYKAFLTANGDCYRASHPEFVNVIIDSAQLKSMRATDLGLMDLRSVPVCAVLYSRDRH